MYFQLATAANDDGFQQQHYTQPISPLLGGPVGGAGPLHSATTLNLSSMISPFYQPLGHLSPALFMPSLLGSSSSFMNSLLVSATGSGPAQHRKLFIGGLNHETSDEQLRDYYSQWGQVVDCIVIRDPVTRQSRGFGFVTFASTEMADAAMADRPHTIGGKIVDPKRAIPREQMLQAAHCPPAFLDMEPSSECKLILSGIDGFHTVDILRHYFEQFGELEQVEIMGHTGFGFIVYEHRVGVKKCTSQGKWHLINGRKVEVREADYEDVNGKKDSLSPSMITYRSSCTMRQSHRKRGCGAVGREKSGNSVGSHESQSHSPESIQSGSSN